MKLSIVTTLYKSEVTVTEFYNRILETINKLEINSYELIFVNDGSPDSSLEKVLALREKNSKIKVIDLSKNFGHHKAILAGLSYAKGGSIFLIDSDLEEEPELLDQFYLALSNASQIDVFYGVLKKRKVPLLRKYLSNLFYFIFLKILKVDYPKDVLTVRIMNRNYLNSLLSFKEKHLELFSLFVLNGFNQKAVLVQKNYKGQTTYNLVKLFSMAIDSIVTNTNRPFILITYIASGAFFMSLLLTLLDYFLFRLNIQFFLLFLISILIFSSSLIGIYLSKILIEIKNRPLYIIRKVYD